MTAIYYPDCQADSPNGKFSLDASSPHNATINHRDGRPASEDEFGFKYRQHQSEFRFRLLDNTSGQVLWERWQGKGEDSPHELVVSDAGWSILRTHGFRPVVIAVSPAGKDILQVQISGVGTEHVSSEQVDAVCSWNPTHLAHTTGGLFWTGDSWRYFLHHQGRPHFVWRTKWGQRLVIDLERAILLPESDQPDPFLALTLIEQEKRDVYGLLSALSPRMAEVRRLFVRAHSEGREEERERHPLTQRVKSVRSALHLAGVHRIKGCIPFLREWENIDYPSMLTGTTAMHDWWLEVQYFRPILHHALRILGEEPLGFAAYHFADFAEYINDENKRRFPVPERLTDRRARTRQLNVEMSAEEVLQLLGAPDYINRYFHKEDEIYRSNEDWEYDFHIAAEWTTLRITWTEQGRKALINSIEEVPSVWLQSEDRESEILQY